MKTFSSKIFKVEDIHIGGTKEQVVRGGRDKFPLLKKGFKGIKQIGVIGWGSQGPAQAQNLRDSLAGTSIKVKVGLQAGSQSLEKARAAGFTEENGTLDEMYKTISTSDLVILLISDAAQVENYGNIIEVMKPGTILGLSHGFLLGHLDSINECFPNHISVIGVCPKGMGPSVRRLYEQGKEVNGAGINCSFAVEQDDMDSRMTDVALAWAIAIGAPYVFQTTLRNEYKSDIFGERAVLLGGVHGMVEALYREYLDVNPLSGVQAFYYSVEQVTGVISSTISKHGIIGVYDAIAKARLGTDVFARAFDSAYHPYYALLREIYDEVASGNEIRSVVMAGPRLKEFGWSKIDGTHMWKIGAEVRERRKGGDPSFSNLRIYPLTAGFYCGMMMAQIDVLLEHGHCLSEVCNETVIEAVDSLNPYMHARGVAYMVDNCSTTARLGTRKWGPRFDHVTMQQVIPNFRYGQSADKNIWFDKAMHHPIHDALAVCATMRPTVDISVA